MSKSHVSQEWNVEQITRAVGYTAAIFFNGRQNTVRCKSLDDARSWADRLTLAADNGRKALVYAITPEGTSVLVPR